VERFLFTLKQGAMSIPAIDGFVWILVTLFIFFPAQEGRLKTSADVFYKTNMHRTCTVVTYWHIV